MRASLQLANQLEYTAGFDTAELVPLTCADQRIGWLTPPFARQLRVWPDCFDFAATAVSVSDALPDAQTRSQALADCVRALAGNGWISGWRDETYAVWPDHAVADTPPLLHIERAAIRRFGLTAHGANLNAYVGSGRSLRMWVARRSLSKPIDPGLLDNLVGGGIASGFDAGQTLVKECGEEAGMAATLAIRAQPVSRLWSRHTAVDGIHSEVLHVFDLAVPSDFTPQNTDGEVSAFHLLALPELLGLLENGEFSPEPALVVADFLHRHGLLDQASPGHARITALLDAARV